MIKKLSKRGVVFGVAGLIVVLDQITKAFISEIMSLGQSIPIIPSIFHLTFIHNSGAGFGLFQNGRWLLVWVSIIIIGFILFHLDKISAKEKKLQYATAFILGGALGNLIDRLFVGHVVDFLDFRIWPVFNVADSFITVGVVWMVVLLWEKE